MLRAQDHPDILQLLGVVFDAVGEYRQHQEASLHGYHAGALGHALLHQELVLVNALHLKAVLDAGDGKV